MKTFIKSVPDRMPLLLAFAALAFVSALAQAADLPEVTISAPSVKAVDRDAATGAPNSDNGQVQSPGRSG